ncbi:MAG TPA: hypothetical protein VGJ39_01220 [Vicinamibacterales bacterium]|jgi:hypothetical protein
MTPTKDLKAGEPCPLDGGKFVIDEEQRPETLIDRKNRNAASPTAAARFAQRVTDKADEYGVIHRCVQCGYRARMTPAGVSASGDRDAAHARDAGAAGPKGKAAA